MAYPPIINVTVSSNLASTPSNLQQQGAAVSQGGTTLGANGTKLLTAASDLTSILAAPLALTSLTWAAGVATATAAASIPGLSVGETFITTVAGTTPAGYSALVQATITGANTFTYALATDPGTETIPGTYTPPGVGELSAMIASFFGQGTAQAVSVLELGAGDGTSGPPLLDTWIGNNPKTFCRFLVPRNWDGTAAFLALIANYEALDAKVYFHPTTTTVNYTNYTSVMKDVVSIVEAPSIPLTEFDAAAEFQHALSYAPSSSNRMTPNAFAYLYGVTAYPSSGNQTLLKALLAAGTNFVGTGAEGGLSNNLIRNGTCQDKNDVSYWFSVDWVQINGEIQLAAAVINGSNNPLAPLYYDQQGINTLQDTLVEVVNTAISYGLANGTVTRVTLSPAQFSANINNGLYPGMCVVNAVPFSTYTALNPSDYGNKVYNGLSVLYLVQNGFVQIGFNVTITNLAGTQ
jgi:hypothetical protein